MFDIDKWEEIISSLKKNKFRTLLTGFGVFWGMFMLMVLVGAGNGLRNGVMKQFGDFATNSMFVWSNSTSMAYKGFPRGRWCPYEYTDVEILKRRVKGIKVVAPQMGAWGSGGSGITTHGQFKGTYTLQGQVPEYYQVDPADIVSGRYINQMDLIERRKVAVIGKRVVEELFVPGEDPLGQYICSGGIYFKVIGVSSSRHSGAWADEQNKEISIPFTTCQMIFNRGNTVDNFAIVADDDADIDRVENDVRRTLADIHSFHPDDASAMGCSNVGKQFAQVKGLFLGVNILVWIVGIGTLLAGVIGISNIMLIVIKERTQEIGVRRALGAPPLSIIGSIVSESVLLTMVSGVLGMLCGAFLMEGVASLMDASANEGFVDPTVDFNIAVASLVIIIVSGVLAGIIPSQRAMAIKPVDALRDE